MKKGRTHVYFGNGKGKTTAAAGLALRAASYGLTVHAYRFAEEGPAGEWALLEKLGKAFVHRVPDAHAKHVSVMTGAEREAYFVLQQDLFDDACERAQSPECDMVILDGILDAISMGAIQEGEAAYLMKRRYRGCELIFTGKNAKSALTEGADYATEMKNVKHPSESGEFSRRGIEY